MISFSSDMFEAFSLVPPTTPPKVACLYVARACKCFAVIIYNLSKGEGGIDSVSSLLMAGRGNKAAPSNTPSVLTVHLEIEFASGIGEYSVGIFPSLQMTYEQPSPVLTTGGVILDCYLSNTYESRIQLCISRAFEISTDKGVYPESVQEAFANWSPDVEDSDPVSAQEFFANQEAWLRQRRRVKDKENERRAMAAFGVEARERPQSERRDDGMSLGSALDASGRMVFDRASTGAVIAQVGTSAIDAMRTRLRRAVGENVSGDDLERLVHAAIGDIEME
jgi:hypothetical protein